MKQSLCIGGLVASSLLTSLPASAALDDIQISGYGSIVAGQTLGSGEVFTADWHDVGQYDDRISFLPESMLALQARGNLTDKVSYTAQLVAKGVDDFKPEFDWYYLTYEANDNLSFMAGRRTIPMYYFSEFYEVGFAYPWVRPPSNLYWWQINFFNGFHASYNFATGNLDHSITAFYGNENDKDNKMIGSLYSALGGVDYERVSENWKDITGFTWAIRGEWFDLRLMHFTTKTERIHYNGSAVPTAPADDNAYRRRAFTFYGIGGSAQWNNFTGYFDYNFVSSDETFRINRPADIEDEFPTILFTLTYAFDQITPFISYSKADHKQTGTARLPGQSTEDYEQHVLKSVGFRYDYSSNISIKVQYDDFDDQGYAPAGWAFHGDSSAYAIGVDFIF